MRRRRRRPDSGDRCAQTAPVGHERHHRLDARGWQGLGDEPLQRGLGVRGGESDAPARGHGPGGPLPVQDRVQIDAVRPQDRRDQRRHAIQIARRPERDGAGQRQRSSEKGVEDADPCQVPCARIGLREQDEDRRHERGEQRVVHAAHRDGDPG